VQRLVVGEDHRLDLTKARPRFDAQLVDEMGTGALEGSQGVGLTASSVQGAHQQRPQLLTEGMGRGQLRQGGDRRGRVLTHLVPELGLERAQPLLDEAVHRGL
jgi:hypothetical protein